MKTKIFTSEEIQRLIDNCHGWKANKPMSGEDLDSYTNGAHYGDYFDQDGRYLGPDEYGVEPDFNFSNISMNTYQVENGNTEEAYDGLTLKEAIAKFRELQNKCDHLFFWDWSRANKTTGDHYAHVAYWDGEKVEFTFANCEQSELRSTLEKELV